MPDLSLPHMCFTLDHDQAKAVAAFRDRYGMAPQYAVIDRGVMWVGPVPQQAGPDAEDSRD